MDMMQLTTAKYLWEHRDDPKLAEVIRHAQCSAGIKAEIAVLLGDIALLEEQYPNLSLSDTERFRTIVKSEACVKEGKFEELYHLMSKMESALDLRKDTQEIAAELLDIEKSHENAVQLIKNKQKTTQERVLNPKNLPHVFIPAEHYARIQQERFLIDPLGDSGVFFKEVVKSGKISETWLELLKKQSTLPRHPLGIKVFQMLSAKDQEALFPIFREQFILADKNLVPAGFRRDWVNQQAYSLDKDEICQLAQLQDDSLDIKFAISLFAGAMAQLGIEHQKMAHEDFLQLVKETQSHPSQLSGIIARKSKDQLEQFTKFVNMLLELYPLECQDCLHIVLSQYDDEALKDAGVNQAGIQEISRFRSLRKQVVTTPQTRASILQVITNPLLFRIFTVGSDPIRITAVELDSHNAALQDIQLDAQHLAGLEFPETATSFAPEASVQYREFLMAPTCSGAPFALRVTCGSTQQCFVYTQKDLWHENSRLYGTANGLMEEVSFYRGAGPAELEVLNLAKLEGVRVINGNSIECSADISHQLLAKIKLPKAPAVQAQPKYRTVIPVETSDFRVEKVAIAQANALTLHLVFDAAGELIQAPGKTGRFYIGCIAEHEQKNWKLDVLKEGLLRVEFKLSCGEPFIKTFEGETLNQMLSQGFADIFIPAHAELITATLSFLLGERKVTSDVKIAFSSSPLGQFRCFFDRCDGDCVVTLRDWTCTKPFQDEVVAWVSNGVSHAELAMFPDAAGQLRIKEPSYDYTVQIRARSQGVTYRPREPTDDEEENEENIEVTSAQEVLDYIKRRQHETHVILENSYQKGFWRGPVAELTTKDIQFAGASQELTVLGKWRFGRRLNFAKVTRTDKFQFKESYGNLTEIGCLPAQIWSYEKPCAHWSVEQFQMPLVKSKAYVSTDCQGFTGKLFEKQPDYEGALALPAPQLAQNPIAVQETGAANGCRSGAGYGGKGFGKARGKGARGEADDDGCTYFGVAGIMQKFQRGGDAALKCRVSIQSDGRVETKISK